MVEAAMANTLKGGQRSGPGVGWLRGRRILLAEDNLTNQMVATQMLDALGATVDVANDGAEALEMISAADYDLYLIDIEMPRVSGLDVIRSIRGSAAPLCDRPVIAVTAYALREHRDKIAEAGADGLIPKPLLGIEQFGRDIVGFVRRSGADAATASAEDGEDDMGGVVSMKVYRALARSIGGDAMRELLSKIDTDLQTADRRLRDGLQRGDIPAIGAACHQLVSVSGAIGAQTLQALAQQASNAAEAGRGDAAALASAALTQIDQLRGFIAQRRDGRER